MAKTPSLPPCMLSSLTVVSMMVLPPSNILSLIMPLLIQWLRAQDTLVFTFHCCFRGSWRQSRSRWSVGSWSYHPQNLRILWPVVLYFDSINHCFKFVFIVFLILWHKNSFNLPVHWKILQFSDSVRWKLTWIFISPLVLVSVTDDQVVVVDVHHSPHKT